MKIKLFWLPGTLMMLMFAPEWLMCMMLLIMFVPPPTPDLPSVSSFLLGKNSWTAFCCSLSLCWATRVGEPTALI